MDMQTELLLALRLVIAAVLGAMIGYERELHRRSAGLRTFAAVSLGACAFSIISFVVTPAGRETTRIAAQIVTGVGFLGAGVILHGQGHISGLTTSATLWAAAAVGMAVGYGLYILAIVTTVLLLLLLLLRLVPGLERHADEQTSGAGFAGGEPYQEDHQSPYPLIGLSDAASLQDIQRLQDL